MNDPVIPPSDHVAVLPAVPRSRVWIWPIALIAFGLLVVRAQLLNSPLLGGDEYAYYISGQYFPGQGPQTLDPWLQQLNNRLYFAVERVLSELDPTLAAHTIEIWHCLLYVAGGLILFRILERCFDSRSAIAGSVLYLGMPMSAFTATTMPEVEHQFVFYLLAAAFALFWPRWPMFTATVAGVFAAADLYIKPHALAFIAACLATMLASPLIRFRQPVRWTRALGASAVFAAICYVTMILCWRLLGREWTFDPRDAIGALYGNVVTRQTSAGFWITHFSSFASYATAHALSMVLISPLGAVCIWAWTYRDSILSRRTDAEGNDAAASLQLFILAGTLATIAMVANFMTIIGAENPADAAGRILGRHLLFLLPFYVAPIFATRVQQWPRVVTIASLATLGAFGVFAFWLQPTFRLYPWDYPELFAYYVYPNAYEWGWSSGYELGGRLLPFFAVSVGVVTLLKRRWAPYAYGALLLAVVVQGQVQENSWLMWQSDVVRPLTDSGRTARQLLEPVVEGEGIIVGAERYGRMSYALMGFSSAQHVRIKPAGSTLTSSDLPAGIRWMLLVDNYSVEVPYVDSIRIGPLTLYELGPGAPSVDQAEKPIWSGQSITVNPQLAPDSDRLVSFNLSPPWHGWTGAQHAEILLPSIVHGEFVARISAWTVSENVAKPVRLRFGSYVHELRVTDKPAHYEVRATSTEPFGRIVIEMPVHQVNAWSPPVGLAVERIELTRATP